MKRPCDNCSEGNDPKNNQQYCVKFKNCPAWKSWFKRELNTAKEVAYGRLKSSED